MSSDSFCACVFVCGAVVWGHWISPVDQFGGFLLTSPLLEVPKQIAFLPCSTGPDQGHCRAVSSDRHNRRIPRTSRDAPSLHVVSSLIKVHPWIQIRKARKGKCMLEAQGFGAGKKGVAPKNATKWFGMLVWALSVIGALLETNARVAGRKKKPSSSR